MSESEFVEWVKMINSDGLINGLDKAVLDAICQRLGQSARGTRREVLSRIRGAIK